MIGRRGERESGISVLAARHDDDDDDFLNTEDVKNYFIYYTNVHWQKNSIFNLIQWIAQSAGAVEYTDATSAVSVLDMTLKNMMVRFQ